MFQLSRHIFVRAAFFALLLALLGTGQSLPIQAQGEENKAGLVVQFSDGSVQTYCLPLDGDSVTGLDLLLLSGLSVQVEGYGGMGALVCKIGADGCDYPGEACVCKSYGPGGVYWNYFHLQGGTWKKSGAGASGYKVKSGDVEGWAWSSGSPPLRYLFSQVCGAPQPVAVNRPQSPTAMPVAPTSAQTPMPRPPTSTRLPVRPTATNTALPSEPTQVPATLTPLPKPRPTNTREAEPPTTTPEQPSSTPTYTALPNPAKTPTTAPSLTPTETTTLEPAHTSTPPATPTERATSVTPIPNPQSPTSSEEIARNIALGIGGVAITGLAVWRVAGSRRRRQSVGDGRVE